MRTVILGPPPPEVEALIESRRRTGAYRHDEVWEGDLHMHPTPRGRPAMLVSRLNDLLTTSTDPLGLTTVTEVNVPFYAARGVDEAVIVDPVGRTVAWLGLQAGDYAPIVHSQVLHADVADVAARVVWPPVSDAE